MALLFLTDHRGKGQPLPSRSRFDVGVVSPLGTLEPRVLFT